MTKMLIIIFVVLDCFPDWSPGQLEASYICWAKSSSIRLHYTMNGGYMGTAVNFF